MIKKTSLSRAIKIYKSQNRSHKLREDKKGFYNKSVTKSEGGDFNSPIWADFKKLLLLKISVDEFKVHVSKRISKDKRKENRYPMLKKQLLLWYKNNSDLFKNVTLVKKVKNINFLDLDSTLTLRGSFVFNKESVDYCLYPYFAKDEVLTNDDARIMLGNLPHDERNVYIILDVYRAKSYSSQDVNFIGDEYDILRNIHEELIDEWDGLAIDEVA